MPTENRLKDTIDYITENRATLKLSDLDITRLKEIIAAKDRINNGADLSLNWSWYNSRPSKDLRKNIRANILISIYSDEIKVRDTANLAARLKPLSENDLNNELSKKIKDFTAVPPLAIQAVSYTLNARGHDSTRAEGASTKTDTPVPEYMATLPRGGLAVMLIDMQGDVDSGETVTGNRKYDGKDQIEHMADVLEAAKNLGLRIYEIVIDRDAALKGGAQGKVKTIPRLRAVLEQCSSKQKRFMPKEFYNSFQGTPLNDWLAEDKMTTIVVMGYDANTCVLNTIFGTPEAMETLSGRERTKSEIEQWRKETPNSDLYKDSMIPKIEEKRLRGYMTGLLDRNITVITSRSIAASGRLVLAEDYGVIAGQ